MKQNDTNSLKNTVKIRSCCLGEVIALEKLDNDAFSSLILGEGFGVVPSHGEFYSPCGGTVKDISQSKTEITLKTDDGLILIISAAADDESKAIACECYVSPGDKLQSGDKLFKICPNAMTDDIKAAVVITNSELLDSFNIRYGKIKQLTQPVMTAGLI